MNKKREKYYKGLFLIAAIYDILLGIVFTFFYKPVFAMLNISIPEFPGYLSLIGVFILVLGIAYYYIYRGNLKKNIDLIKIGILYKFAYSAVAFYYFFIGIIPNLIFVYVFGILDLIFAFLFIECFYQLKK